MKIYRKAKPGMTILCRTQQEIEDCLNHFQNLDYDIYASVNFSAPLYIKVEGEGELSYPDSPKDFIYFSSIAFHDSDFLVYDSDILKDTGNWELFVGKEEEFDHVRCYYCGRIAHEITDFCPYCGKPMKIQYRMNDEEIDEWLSDNSEDLFQWFGCENEQDIKEIYNRREIIKIIHNYKSGNCFEY